MKKIFIILSLLFVSCSLFAQKIIEKPDYGLSNLPGKLTKIELTDSATIFHFYIQYSPGQWIQVPKNSYIKDVNGDEKYLVTQTEGIPLGVRYTMPESGEASYKVFFPKLKAGISKIDFGEGNNDPNNWSVYDIVINEEKEASVFPKELKGNWFKTDGSKQYDYGFNSNQAIFDQAVWNYKTIDKKKNNYTIVLENKGKEKTIYAKINKKGGVDFGEEKEKLVSYSTEQITNLNYKLANDEVYSSNIFKTDSVTYSGFIKGFTSRAGIKTGTVYVSNVLSGKQDSHLVEIDENGSFSLKFSVNHPQFIYVKLVGNFDSVFVEPGKKIFQVIDAKKSLFMGDGAIVNMELKALEKIGSYKEYQNLNKKILETSPEDHKKTCLEIKNKQLDELNAMAQKQFISSKTLQIKKLDIDFLAYEQILSYEMNREYAERSKAAKETNQLEKKELEILKLDASYYDFITESVLNNELAVLSVNYGSFINRLRFANVLSSEQVTFISNFTSDRAVELQKSGIVLTKEELQLAEVSKVEEKISKKSLDFIISNYKEIENFKKKYSEVYSKLKNTKKDKQVQVSVEELATQLLKDGIILNPQEKELVSNYKLAQPTKEEIAVQKQFVDKYGESLKAFGKKYETNIDEIDEQKSFKKTNDKLKEVFGNNESFVFDVFALQEKSGVLDRNFTPYSERQLQTIQTGIKNPFLANYIVLENDKMKSKLEENKSKTGFVVNTINTKKGDELFNSMISKFKGKVVYVDFWATWCGPCKSSIKEIAPLKEEMKNQDVVFLYVTGETSPLKTWENSIPDIKGEHYRVSEDEWNYLTSKFNISGIPHYVLVNKNGEVANPKLGHLSNEVLKVELDKRIKE